MLSSLHISDSSHGTMVESDKRLLNNMDSVCRLCLSEDQNTVSIFENNDKHAVPLPIQIMSCAQIQVYVNDGLPAQACASCVEKVELWFEFKGVCTRSDERLRQLIIKKETMSQWEEVGINNSPKPEEPSQNSTFCQYENGQPQEVEVPEVECDVGFASDRFEDSDSENSVENDKINSHSSRHRRNIKKVQIENTNYSQPMSEMDFSSLDEESGSDGDADWDEFKCEVCDKVLKSDAALKKHKLNHARKRKFPCTICGKAFLFKNHQVRHERNLHGKGLDEIFHCSGCERKFTREFELKAHIRTHADVVTFECEYCKKVLDDEPSLSDHIRVHLSDRPHICETCGKAFIRHCHLKKHMWTHSDEKKPHQCTHCTKSFLTSSSLQDHVRMHTGVEKPYLCTHCGKSFSQAPALIMHEKIHATGHTHLCKYCPKSFTSAVEVSEHMKDNHSGEKPFTCGTCGKTFAMQVVYVKHVKRHESLFLCNVCGKTFASKQCLKRHVRIHTGEKPYLCQYCNTYFRTSAHLVEHVRIHTGDRPYACETCGKTFARRTHLQQHVRSHTGEKPYVCKYCGKPWASSSNLAEHVRIHTGEKPYICQICGQAFGKRSAMQEHLKGHSASEDTGSVPIPSPVGISMPISSAGQLPLSVPNASEDTGSVVVPSPVGLSIPISSAGQFPLTVPNVMAS